MKLVRSDALTAVPDGSGQFLLLAVKSYCHRGAFAGDCEAACDRISCYQRCRQLAESGRSGHRLAAGRLATEGDLNALTPGEIAAAPNRRPFNDSGRRPG